MAATAVVVAVAAGALALALGAPLWTTAIALMAFGVLHNALELRYLGGRFPGLLRGPYLLALVGLVTGIVVARLIGSVAGAGWSVRAEIVLSYGLLATAVIVGARATSGRRPWRAPALALLAGAALVSLRWPDHHVVVVTHLHNLIPLGFLWELSRPMARRPRRVFRVAQVGWVVVLPVLILAGLFDGALRAGEVPGLGGVSRIAPFSSLPDAWDTTAGRRFLAVFAFLQLMHFVIWVIVIPRCTPRATATFEARLPALRGRHFWWVAGAGAGAFAVLFLVDYAEGRTAYAALASYHAYLELPLLIGVAVAATASGRSHPHVLRA